MLEVITVLLGMIAGWALAMVQNYFSEKGKNLATKEDIEEITNKIETVKAEIGKKNRIANLFIDRKIRAFDEISDCINQLWLYATSKDGHIVHKNIDKEEFKNNLSELRELSYTHNLYTSETLDKKIEDLIKNSEDLYQTDRLETERYQKYAQNCSLLISLLQQELFKDDNP